MTTTTPSSFDSKLGDGSEIAMKQRMLGLAYARASGIGLGIFMILWIPLSYGRWLGQGPSWLLNFQAVFFTIYGILLIMPWNKIDSEKVWKYFFYGLVVCSFIFTFVMVFDTMFQHILASQFASRPAPPAFQGMQIFFGLMQVPVVLFLRRPQLLD